MKSNSTFTSPGPSSRSLTTSKSNKGSMRINQSGKSEPKFDACCFRGIFPREKTDNLYLYPTGPFTDRVNTFCLDPRSSDKIKIGRYTKDALVQNDIEFQDSTVEIFAAEIAFNKTIGFSMKCLSTSGAHLVYTSRIGTPVSEFAAQDELIEIPHCSAIRFGTYSWITATPFISTFLQLSGVYDNMEIVSIMTADYSIMGSGAAAQACIPGDGVEDNHSCIIKTSAGFMLKDLSHEVGGSGTFINGVEIVPPTGVILFPGARISMGLNGPSFIVKTQDWSTATKKRRSSGGSV